MKKTIAAIISVAILLLSITSIYAHPGRTDSSGGHTDHSTGDYHYHHGYSAHDHYDMDGDGDRDCPYDFDDKTGSISGSSSSSSNTNSYQSSSDAPKVYHYEIEEVNEVPPLIYWIIAALCAAIVIMVFIIRSKNKELVEQKESFRIEANKEHLFVRDGVIALNAALTKKFGEDYLYRISGAPTGDYVDKYLLPHSGDWEDSYTFYLGGPSRTGSTKYHTRDCIYGKIGYPINAISIKEKKYLEPCSVCRPKLPNTDWVAKYRDHKTFFRKYIFSLGD